MDGVEILLILIIFSSFFNALRHFNGLAQKGKWQGYSGEGQFYLGLSCLCYLSSSYIKDYWGYYFVSEVALFIFLLTLFKSLRVERKAQQKYLKNMSAQMANDNIRTDLIFSFQVGVIVAVIEIFNYFMNEESINWLYPIGAFSFVIILRLFVRMISKVTAKSEL
ncbi:hypothetical protein RI844_00465 [Thalassotalea fonticola]|uniref:DUF2809 domain-containing protein n=1 Tax=Thalassotalea fonticola TaxID=3065649 RepID=A0ABZ0GPZ8_9GAMM|nr:hypothetical protein RI844_00465 [Colwelliaceae bacterium S1-1]